MENKNLIYTFNKVDFVPARKTCVVSVFPVGSRNGRQVIRNCDGRTCHSL